MICKKCHGRGYPYTLEVDLSSNCRVLDAVPCECGGCGIVHCCEGECVDQAEKEKPHEAKEAK